MLLLTYVARFSLGVVGIRVKEIFEWKSLHEAGKPGCRYQTAKAVLLPEELLLSNREAPDVSS